MNDATCKPHKWNLESCKIDALRFKTRKEWQMKSGGPYRYALDHGFIDECCLHMPILHRKWTFEELKKEALNYKNRKQWHLNSAASYKAAQVAGLLDECCKHMKILHVKWTLEECKRIALKYNRKVDWAKNDKLSYESAGRNKWLDECCKHMLNLGCTSGPEILLTQKVVDKYPTAKKKIFTTKITGIKNKRFELDIYIPELRKGIEFNGDYWHGKGFKRSWTNSPDEYHRVKHDFFSQLNINYIEIWEKDWTRNQEECLIKIWKFLNE